MQTVVIVIHLMIVLAMIGFVMLQRSEGGGLGMGGSGGGFMSSRGTANVLTRATGFLGNRVFHHQPGVVDHRRHGPQAALAHSGWLDHAIGLGAPAPLAPGGGLLDTLQGGSQGGTPAAPPAPSGPQVPQSR